LRGSRHAGGIAPLRWINATIARAWECRQQIDARDPRRKRFATDGRE
jgi:hypothetical protein